MFQLTNKYIFNALYLHIAFLIHYCILHFLQVDSFFFGNQGQHDCPGGDFIRDEIMCRKACTLLVLPIKEISEGFVCYKDYRGHCFQNGQNGGGASMVCKQTP